MLSLEKNQITCILVVFMFDFLLFIILVTFLRKTWFCRVASSPVYTMRFVGVSLRTLATMATSAANANRT